MKKPVIAVFQKGSKMGYVLPEDYEHFMKSFLEQPDGSAVTLVRAELDEGKINERQKRNREND